MSKEITYTCDLCEREGDTKFVVGFRRPTEHATRLDIDSPERSDKHVCGDCIKTIRRMLEELVPTGTTRR